MNDILDQSNITHGNNYTYQKISDAVSKVTQGKKPAVKCFRDHISRRRNNLVLDKITLFFDKSLNLFQFHDDPLDKYPTLREDNNDYYLLSQKAYPAECLQHCSNSTKYQKPKCSWIIREFTFILKNNIDFSCGGNDPHNYDAKYNFTSLSSIKNEIVDKWENKDDYNSEYKEILMRDLIRDY
ncbi:uncharacterized protein LOC123270771 [Cotesia glomerata]|uniref:uncharacterized protein LOC123270771 n=1 Tax=Cotesia glomerata TaxID=32391 RepID=UPI001D024AFD|nr:uncharacterized protein LOC123270771 [Cotesia glomerata]